MVKNRKRVGVWVAGVLGDIGSTLIVGTLALEKGIVSRTGLTTDLSPFDQLGLVEPGGIRFGGTDVRNLPLRTAAQALNQRSMAVSSTTLEAVSSGLAAIERDILYCPELAWDPERPDPRLPGLSDLLAQTRRRIREFRARHDLERVVVVNLMSAMPEPSPSESRDTVSGIEKLIESDRKDLVTPSVCYAWAALLEGCPYIDFTPNAGSDWAGIAELASTNRLPFCGSDGKTGETLIKTALAHMFAYRNLKVMSWEGVNLLGNNDGRTLDVERNKQGKLRNKSQVLPGILGYEPHAGVTINYVPSLGDWKTAWDLIHFQGFMDVPMTMQFTWQGCDSFLAAPLVLDMVRLADFAVRNGEAGPMRHLAAFFKHPVGVDEMDFHLQFRMLVEYAERHLAALQPEAD